MGCGSSNATATAPEANVVKQRRRLSVGNVDTSDLVYIFFWEKTHNLMDLGGHWEVLEMYMDIIHIHFFWPGLGFERTSLHLFLWGV